MKFLFSVLTSLALFFCGVQLCLAGTVSATLPLDSWVYPALDRLSALGLVQSALQGTRPFSRDEAARQVAEALANAKGRPLPPAVVRLLAQLKEALHGSLQEVNRPEEAPDYFRPLRTPTLGLIYREGRSSPIAGTNARQFPLNENNFGLHYRQGTNLQLTFQSEARLGHLLAEWRPVISARGIGRQGATASLRTLEGAMRLGLGPMELSAGRQALWWGEGRHGTLILTDNAKPLDMVRLTNPVPVLLPSVLRFLGPFRIDSFISRLGKQRHVPSPNLVGLRLDMRPLPWWELGMSRTVLFGGKGVPGIGFADFLGILAGHNKVRNDNSDSLAALDTRIRLPILFNTTLYGEWGGEDAAGGIPTNNAWLAGLYLPAVDPSGRTALRIEYADLSYLAHNSPPWYRHQLYQSGYTYQGDLLGHPAGGAARDLFVETRTLLPAGFTLGLSFDYQERGLDQPVTERHYMPGISARWFLPEGFSLGFAYRLDQVENFAFSPHSSHLWHFAQLQASAAW